MTGQCDKNFRKATMRENLMLIRARLSDHLSPAEMRELQEAAVRLQECDEHHAPPSSTRRTMTLPDVIGPVTPLVGEVAERCGDMDGTESMQEVVAGVLNALVQTFEEWPQGFAASAIEQKRWTEAGEAALEKWWQKWREQNGYPNTERMRWAARSVYLSLADGSIDTMVEQLRAQGHLRTSDDGAEKT